MNRKEKNTHKYKTIPDQAQRSGTGVSYLHTSTLSSLDLAGPQGVSLKQLCDKGQGQPGWTPLEAAVSWGPLNTSGHWSWGPRYHCSRLDEFTSMGEEKGLGLPSGDASV